jgi:hypothetical protein
MKSGQKSHWRREKAFRQNLITQFCVPFTFLRRNVGHSYIVRFHRLSLWPRTEGYKGNNNNSSREPCWPNVALQTSWISRLLKFLCIRVLCFYFFCGPNKTQGHIFPRKISSKVFVLPVLRASCYNSGEVTAGYVSLPDFSCDSLEERHRHIPTYIKSVRM